MLSNSAKSCSKYGAFFESPVLLTLVRSASARQQGAAENPVFVLLTQSRNLMDSRNFIGEGCIKFQFIIIIIIIIIIRTANRFLPGGSDTAHSTPKYTSHTPSTCYIVIYHSLILLQLIKCVLKCAMFRDSEARS
jgi:hypothetical protein